jgi:hypothetical protein
MDIDRDRLAAAADGAFDRLVAALANESPDEAFAPLGETLAWINAIYESTGRYDPLLQGLAHARNRVLHGEGIIVGKPTTFLPGAGKYGLLRVLMEGGTARWEWSFVNLPEPTQERYRKQWAAYEDTVAGTVMLTTLARAFEILDL